jgi:hypothetical protein
VCLAAAVELQKRLGRGLCPTPKEPGVGSQAFDLSPRVE